MPRGVFPIFSFVLGVVYEHLLSAGSRFIGLIIISITAMVRGERKRKQNQQPSVFLERLGAMVGTSFFVSF